MTLHIKGADRRDPSQAHCEAVRSDRVCRSKTRPREAAHNPGSASRAARAWRATVSRQRDVDGTPQQRRAPVCIGGSDAGGIDLLDHGDVPRVSLSAATTECLPLVR